jgi:hypothetical protein
VAEVEDSAAAEVVEVTLPARTAVAVTAMTVAVVTSAETMVATMAVTMDVITDGTVISTVGAETSAVIASVGPEMAIETSAAVIGKISAYFRCMSLFWMFS